MKWIKQVLSIHGEASSKRVTGITCILFVLIMFIVTYFTSGGKDLPQNVQIALITIFSGGIALLTATVFENKTPSN